MFLDLSIYVLFLYEKERKIQQKTYILLSDRGPKRSSCRERIIEVEGRVEQRRLSFHFFHFCTESRQILSHCMLIAPKQLYKCEEIRIYIVFFFTNTKDRGPWTETVLVSRVNNRGRGQTTEFSCFNSVILYKVDLYDIKAEFTS